MAIDEKTLAEWRDYATKWRELHGEKNGPRVLLLIDEVERLRAENAKLYELRDHAYSVASWFCGIEHCPDCDGHFDVADEEFIHGSKCAVARDLSAFYKAHAEALEKAGEAMTEAKKGRPE